MSTKNKKDIDSNQSRGVSNKRRDLRILWQSNSPSANSGYSVFTRDLLFRLLKDDWKVECSSMGAGVDSYPVFMYGEDLDLSYRIKEKGLL